MKNRALLIVVIALCVAGCDSNSVAPDTASNKPKPELVPAGTKTKDVLLHIDK